MNFLLAFVCMILHGLLYKYGSSGLILNYLYVLTYYGAVLNIGLGVFNLIPIPPLDGSNILAEIFPRVAEFYWKIRPYSMWILLLLLGTGILDVPISLPSYFGVISPSLYDTYPCANSCNETASNVAGAT